MSMKGLVEYLARELVDSPDAISVNEVRGNQLTILRLKVDQADMGRVIGRQGRIAQALRNQSGDQIGAAPRWIRHHEPHGFGGPRRVGRERR